MKRSTVGLLVLALALLPALALAQAQKDDATKLDLLEGRVVRIDKQKSTLEVRQSGPSTVTFRTDADGLYRVALPVAGAWTFRGGRGTATAELHGCPCVVDLEMRSTGGG